MPHRAVAGDTRGLGQCPGDFVEQRFDGVVVGHHPPQTGDQGRRHVAKHDIIGRLGVFERADARLDGGELRPLGIDAPRDGGLPLGQQMAHQFGRRVVLQHDANTFQRQAERPQHHQAVQIVELRRLVIAIAGGAIDICGFQQADRLIVAQRLDRNAAAAAESADPEHHGRTVASPLAGESSERTQAFVSAALSAHEVGGEGGARAKRGRVRWARRFRRTSISFDEAPPHLPIALQWAASSPPLRGGEEFDVREVIRR